MKTLDKRENTKYATGNKLHCHSLSSGYTLTSAYFHLPVIFCLLLIANCQLSYAQQPITLSAAIDTALKNNLTVKNERLKADYRQQLIKSAKLLPPANVIAEAGQFNSYYIDARFGASQTISFPKVYSSQRALLTEEWKAGVLNVGVQERVLKKQVMQAYYTLLYLQEKKKLLQKTDTLFAQFLEKALLRFNKGESNVLEKTTAENQRGQISLQLLQLQQDMEVAQLQFQLLLNTETIFIPAEKTFKLDVLVSANSFALQDYPALQYYRQQQQVAAAATQAEKAKLLPNFTIGYNIMSMKGAGANYKYYNSAPQFQYMLVGLGIPIFNGAQKARINAAKTNELIAANEYELNARNIQFAYQQALAAYQKQTEAIRYFETTAIGNANVIIETANRQFLGGDIDYLQWVLLINQAVTIQSDYVETLKNRNVTGIEINSLIMQ